MSLTKRNFEEDFERVHLLDEVYLWEKEMEEERWWKEYAEQEGFIISTIVGEEESNENSENKQKTEINADEQCLPF